MNNSIWIKWVKLKKEYENLRKSKSTYDQLRRRVFKEIIPKVENILIEERQREFKLLTKKE